MEATKSVPPENKAVSLANDLNGRDSLLHPLTDAFRALIKHEKRPADEVRGDLIKCLNTVVQDETGTLALNLVIEINPEVIKKIFGVDISKEYGALDKTVINVMEQTSSFETSNPPFNMVSMVMIQKTPENQVKALQIVKALIPSQSDVI